jgi:HK97 family phage prohead protease
MNKQREVRFIKAKEFRVVTNPDGSRSIQGYASVFNLKSVDFGGWSEMVSPSAFNRTLQENPDVLCLFNHHSGKVLGRTKSGTLSLEIDNVGLKFVCNLPDTSVANDLIVSIDRGDIDGCSFGFVCQSDVWTAQEDGGALRTLLDVDLFEVTITPEPAYPDTSVSLRSAPKEVRSRIIEKRDDDMETDSDGDTDTDCGCDCPQCEAGSCGICSDPDCDDENCSCPSDEIRSIRHKMEMRLRLAQARSK